MVGDVSSRAAFGALGLGLFRAQGLGLLRKFRVEFLFKLHWGRPNRV